MFFEGYSLMVEQWSSKSHAWVRFLLSLVTKIIFKNSPFNLFNSYLFKKTNGVINLKFFLTFFNKNLYFFTASKSTSLVFKRSEPTSLSVFKSNWFFSFLDTNKFNFFLFFSFFLHNFFYKINFYVRRNSLLILQKFYLNNFFFNKHFLTNNFLTQRRPLVKNFFLFNFELSKHFFLKNNNKKKKKNLNNLKFSLNSKQFKKQLNLSELNSRDTDVKHVLYLSKFSKRFAFFEIFYKKMLVRSPFSLSKPLLLFKLIESLNSPLLNSETALNFFETTANHNYKITHTALSRHSKIFFKNGTTKPIVSFFSYNQNLSSFSRNV